MAEGEVALEINKEPPSPRDDENPSESNNGEDLTDSNNGEIWSESEEVQSTKDKCLEFAGNVLQYILIGILLIVFLLVYLLYTGMMWLFCNINVTEEKPEEDVDPRRGKAFGDIFERVEDLRHKANKWGKIPHVVQSRLNIFMFLWLIVNFSVPFLRNKLILGTKLWKWTLAITVILFGYHVINMLTRSLIYTLCLNSRFRKKQSSVYYLKGTRHSLNLVAQAALILVTWFAFFRTSRGIKKTDDTHTLLHVCTWSFVTFSVLAVMWLLKSVLLLKWKADTVYRRFSQRILVARVQVYILGCIFGWSSWVAKPTYDDEEEMKILEGDIELMSEPSRITDLEPTTQGVGEQPEMVEVAKTANVIKMKKEAACIYLEKDKAKKILLRHKKDVTLYNIQNMAEYLVGLFKVFSRYDQSTLKIMERCSEINAENDPDGFVDAKDLVRCFDLGEEDAKIIYRNLQETLGSPTISHRDFEKLMVRAHNNCVALGRTLLDAGEVAKVLNHIMIVILFGIVSVAWLLLTDIATTKVLVLIGSPLLVATFIFGDTCKKMFEGVIFSFINHPFDVGDRCIIDKNEVEVRRMSIFTTTFVVIGTKEELLYPNSTLAAIPILNSKSEPHMSDYCVEVDLSDYVELTLDSNYTVSMIGKLDCDIHDLFEDAECIMFEKTISIVVKEIGDSVKMEVQFNHVMSVHEITLSQCLKKKMQQKSLLLLQIKQLIEEINNKGDRRQ